MREMEGSFAEFCVPVLLILSFVLNLSGDFLSTSPVYFLYDHLVALMQKSYLP